MADPLEPISDDELATALASILRNAGSAALGRYLSCHLAGVAGEHIAAQLAQAGLVVAKPAPATCTLL